MTTIEADTSRMELAEFYEEIDSILRWVAENSMGEYVKVDQINDKLLDLRLRLPATV